ncbi:MAG: biotin/lipoyl-binding protein [Chloroflexi bacterium]|nr:biotin/lipoyl-binding protein [Chloroflexota bacterium]
MATNVRVFRIRVGQRWYTVELSHGSGPKPQVLVDGEPVDVEIVSVPRETRAERAPQAPVSAPAPVAAPSQRPAAASSSVITSPMPGRIVAVSVKVGRKVSSGSEVCVLEAMKMEQSIRVARSGSVKAVHVKEGQQVQAGQPLVELE